MNTSQTTTQIDPGALSALLAYWLHRAGKSKNYKNYVDYQYPEETARALVGLAVNDEKHSGGTGFCSGFRVAVEVSAAVLSDPFGDPTNELKRIAKRESDDLEEFIRVPD